MSQDQLSSKVIQPFSFQARDQTSFKRSSFHSYNYFDLRAVLNENWAYADGDKKLDT
jgi:hypothetical protein